VRWRSKISKSILPWDGEGFEEPASRHPGRAHALICGGPGRRQDAVFPRTVGPLALGQRPHRAARAKR